MFALRGIAVSLTFFVLAYCLLSAIVAVSWRSLKWMRAPERVRANFLFMLRVLPLVAAIAITLIFVVPSFQMLEPRGAEEGLGATPFALGVCALLLIAAGCARVIAAQVKTSRVVARWLEGARPLTDCEVTETFCSHSGAPPLTLVGVRRSKVLVSEATMALLTEDELQIALKHEVAHMRSRDNLKKLIFRFCPFPGLARLEEAWGQTAELAADDAAVSRMDDAVDLAAALVKLSRLVPVQSTPVCTIGFVSGSIQSRVTRLLTWEEVTQGPSKVARFAILPALIAFAFMVTAYGPILFLTHEITEWLVR